MYTFGYISHEANSASLIGRGIFACSSARFASRSTGGSTEPGRTASGSAPASTFFCSAGGKPPTGWPMSPRNRDTTDSGNATSTSGSSTSSRLSPLVTIMIAMSPTTFDDGVTLTMSPNISLTSA